MVGTWRRSSRTVYGSTNRIGHGRCALPAVARVAEVDWQAGDAALLCVKTQDSVTVLDELRRVAPDVPVVCVQNGVANERVAAARFPSGKRAAANRFVRGPFCTHTTGTVGRDATAARKRTVTLSCVFTPRSAASPACQSTSATLATAGRAHRPSDLSFSNREPTWIASRCRPRATRPPHT